MGEQRSTRSAVVGRRTRRTVTIASIWQPIDEEAVGDTKLMRWMDGRKLMREGVIYVKATAQQNIPRISPVKTDMVLTICSPNVGRASRCSKWRRLV